MYARRKSGPPAWFVILIVMALVFGVYYLFTGIQDFFSFTDNNVTASQVTQAGVTPIRSMLEPLPTLRPTSTPIPECKVYFIAVERAIVRGAATTNSAVMESLTQGAEICVIAREPGTEWYLIDLDPSSRFIDRGYIRADLVQSRDPTPTPTNTIGPAPTVTLTPSWTPSQSATADPLEQSAPTLPPLEGTLFGS